MGDPIANPEMAAAWDGAEGDDWARDWKRYDQAVAHHHRALLGAAAVEPPHRVLDVGCGTGEVTRDVARAAQEGSALGIDLSARMLDRARELAEAQRCANARFEQADAQVHPFDQFDIVVSRFGSMFFADPVAAFSNLRRALRPGGRLAMVVWRDIDANEWLRCVFAALAIGRDLPGPLPGAPGPLGLADRTATRAILERGGFDQIDITPLDLPFWAGADGADAFGFFQSTGVARGLTQGLDDADRSRAFDALHATMSDHDTGEGVWFESGSWLVTAGT